MIKYKGNGNYIQGVPARDLSMDEWNSLSKELQEAAMKSGLYEMPKLKAKDGE